MSEQGTTQVMNAHTPKPSSVGRNCIICKVPGGSTTRYQGFYAHVQCAPKVMSLIAAAPDLLKALENVLNVGRGTSGRLILEYGEEQQIRAAIAKARGER